MSGEYLGWSNYQSHAVFDRLLLNDSDFAATSQIVDIEGAPERMATIPTDLRTYVERLLQLDATDAYAGPVPHPQAMTAGEVRSYLLTQSMSEQNLARDLLIHALDQVDWFEVAANLRAEAQARRELGDSAWGAAHN